VLALCTAMTDLNLCDNRQAGQRGLQEC